jgi:hypothetical protein
MIVRLPGETEPGSFQSDSRDHDDIVDFPTFSAKLHFVTDKQVFGALETILVSTSALLASLNSRV